MGQHGIILEQLRNNKCGMKLKTSKYFKMSQLLHDEVPHPTGIQSIDLL